ncbi:MAG: ubiquinol-cytochrome c reductase iron-sulfur subunit [Rubrobacteraceae bacterium]
MKEGISRKRFIRLGAAIGVSAAGATVVAACGGGGESGGGGDDSASGGGNTATSGGDETISSGSERSSEAIAQTSEVPTNSAKPFTNDEQPAVLVHLEDGDFAAYSAVCTHQQCTVEYQQDTGELACPCHGSLFDPADGGKVVNGPAQQPLPEIPIQVEDGQVKKA